jgi:hypothetical protein
LQSELQSAFLALNSLLGAVVEVTELSDCVSVAPLKHASDIALLLVNFFYTLWHEHVEWLVLGLDRIGCAAVRSLTIALFVLQAPLILRGLPLSDLVDILLLL